MPRPPRITTLQTIVWGPLVAAGVVLAVSPALARSVAVGLPPQLSVLVLILALAYLSVSLERSGFFEWFALRIIARSRGNGRRLVLSLFAGVSVVTFVTSNDIVIIAMTPVVMHLGRRAGLTNLTPFLLTLFIAANTASMGLYIGNPTNIVIADAAGIDFLGYAQRMFAPTVVATLCAAVLVWLLFCVRRGRHRVPRWFAPPRRSVPVPWTRAMTIKTTMFGACVLCLAGAGSAAAVVVVAVLCAAAAMVFDLVVDRRRSLGSGPARARLRRLPFEIVPFFVGCFVLLTALHHAGFTAWAAARVVDAFDAGPVAGSLASGTLGVAAVTAMNNIPASLLFEQTWAGTDLAAQLHALQPTYPDIFVDASLFAANFGANLTSHGALAGLIWLRIIDTSPARVANVRVPTARDLVAHGLFVVPIVTIVTCVAIALLRGSGG